MNPKGLRILSGIIILGLSVVTLIFNSVPFIWIGGFIWAGYLFIKAFEVGKKEKQDEDLNAKFNASDRWKEKAKDQDELLLKVKEITTQYGAGYAANYLVGVEKLSTEETAKILADAILGDAFSSPKIKNGDNPCPKCGGFGFITKPKKNLFGKLSKRITCPECCGSGTNKN